MNAPPALFPDDTPRPLWRAGLACQFAQATMALVPAMMLREALILHFDEGRGIGVAPIIRPEMWTPGWFGELALAYGWGFLSVVPGTLLFLSLLKWLERREPATTLEWAVAGAASALPLAAGLCILVLTVSHIPPELMLYLITMGPPVVIGLCAGAFAWHFRHHRRHDWSDPL